MALFSYRGCFIALDLHTLALQCLNKITIYISGDQHEMWMKYQASIY